MNSATIVFSIALLKDAIFAYRAAAADEQRAAKLLAIGRGTRKGSWSPMPSNWGGYYYSTASSWFERMRWSVCRGTGLLELTELLGLKRATYLDFLESRESDRNWWLAACSAGGGSTTWCEAGEGSKTRLDAHPRQHDCKFNAPREKPSANPMEVLYYCTGRSVYGMTPSPTKVQHWSETEGLSQLVHDERGRIYVARLLDTSRSPFLFEAAAKHLNLLYSDESPLLPVYDAIDFGSKDDVGLVITQCPPFPLGNRLLPDEGQDELRRVLERAKDLFAHLATLRRYGVSLDGQRPSDQWSECFLTGKSHEPLLVPAYLAPSFDTTNKFVRLGQWDEKLPEAPEDAWPLAPLKGRGGVAGLPWSQITAYNDPRVAGPRVYLHGVNEASFSAADSEQRVQSRGEWKGSTSFPFPEKATDRFNFDLLVMTDCILRRFFPLKEVWGPSTVKLLESPAASLAYEQQLERGGTSELRDATLAHSGLFTFCANCALQLNKDLTFEDPLEACATCNKRAMVNAMPNTVRQLLLRIVRPEKLENGQLNVVTAEEALDVMESVMETELPKLERIYSEFVGSQPKVKRIDTSPVMSLDTMRRDLSHYRLICFELLRGNYVETRFRRAAYVDLSNQVRRHLARKQEKEEEGQAAAAAAAAAAAQEEEASPSSGKEGAVMATVVPHSNGLNASVEDDELQRAMAQSLEDAKIVKRSAEGEVDGAASVKRIKGV